MTISRNSRYCSKGGGAYFCHFLPEGLDKRLLTLSERNRGGLLFQREDGKPFTHNYLAHHFRRASKVARAVKAIKSTITPSHCKITPVDPIKFTPGTVREIPDAKVELVEKLLLAAKSKMNNRRKSGSPRKHHLKQILQAILAKDDFYLSWRRLKEKCPNTWRAAWEQARRWKDLGILDRVMQILKR